MKIASSEIAMSSRHFLSRRDEKSETMRFWTGNNGPDNNRSNMAVKQLAERFSQDIVDISAKAKELFKSQVRALEKLPEDSGGLTDISPEDNQRIQLIQDFIEAVTGKKIKIVVPEKLKLEEVDCKDLQLVVRGKAAEQGADRAGWGLTYDYHEFHAEQEQTTFSAGGVVKTADGREINFSLAMSMSRSFESRTDISIRAGDALKDPLVINFTAPAAQLSPQKYDFDIDADGVADKISFVGPGSGFLTLDANNDGIVNDGSELFGPQSGNGFAELAKFDSDGNNWIDENDAVFGKLRLWTKDGNGQDYYLSLSEAGVGAIYLGNADTPFALKDAANVLQGQVRRSGVFLRENGLAGSIQQVDLAV